jgi:deazaflavin-dependent oxidoreductase (nitroreductase family)
LLFGTAMAFTRSPVIDFVWKLHPGLYRWTGGRFLGTMRSLPVLVLNTIGRKTGRTHPRALMYLPRGRDFVVIASVLGGPKHPHWFLNLEKSPDAEVEVGRARYPVRARVAAGREREELWHAFAAKTDDYQQTQARTAREFPVVVLERQ